jgi:hypothetical protein
MLPKEVLDSDSARKMIDSICIIRVQNRCPHDAFQAVGCASFQGQMLRDSSGLPYRYNHGSLFDMQVTDRVLAAKKSQYPIDALIPNEIPTCR